MISTYIYEFSKDNKPADRITGPASYTFKTLSCYGDLTPDVCDPDKINPATGPLFVEGAMPGDTLKVTVKAINLAPKGVVKVSGFMKHEVEGLHWHGLAIEDDSVVLAGRRLPLKKMIGVIGVAPAGQSVPTVTPGKHGANMDAKIIGEGASVYLPVQVEGALLAMGDVHALMGDGETGGTGIEIGASIDVDIEVIKGQLCQWPMVETDDFISIITSAETLDEASEICVKEMASYLAKVLELPLPEATMLLGLAGDLKVCQIVNPLKTARFEFPKKYL